MPTLMRIVALSREQGHASRAEPREAPHLSRIYLVLITRTTTYRVPVRSEAVLARGACVDPRRKPACNGSPQSSLRSPAVARSTLTSRLTFRAAD